VSLWGSIIKDMIKKFFSRGKAFWHWSLSHKKFSIPGLIILLIILFLFRPKPPVPVPTQKVLMGDLVQSLSVSSTTDATNTANLTFPAGGKVVYVGAKKDDQVLKFQTIVILDQRTVEANIQNAVDSLSSQQIAFDIVNDFNGDRTLADTGLSVSARRQLQTALNTKDQAQITLTIQQIAKEQSVLFSPINGILTRADITLPNVTATTTTTYTVVDPTSVVLHMDVDQADIGKVKIGQPVSILFDAYPTEAIHMSVSKIDFVSHTTANGGNAYTVEASLPDNSNYTYRVGMQANADITTAEKKNVLQIPLQAVTDDSFVYVKMQGRFVKRKVTLGLQNDTNTQILSGLSQEDIVALDPVAAVKQLK